MDGETEDDFLCPGLNACSFDDGVPFGGVLPKGAPGSIPFIPQILGISPLCLTPTQRHSGCGFGDLSASQIPEMTFGLVKGFVQFAARVFRDWRLAFAQFVQADHVLLHA
jgi:hypothetical protein